LYAVRPFIPTFSWTEKENFVDRIPVKIWTGLNTSEHTGPFILFAVIGYDNKVSVLLLLAVVVVKFVMAMVSVHDVDEVLRGFPHTLGSERLNTLLKWPTLWLRNPEGSTSPVPKHGTLCCPESLLRTRCPHN
jgi:hypothetical protein